MKHIRLINLILNLLLAAVLLAGPARAIDCAKASTKLDHVICADPKLIEADAKLNDSYVKAMSTRSAAGKIALRASQKEWLKGIAADKDASTYSVGESFKTRLAELEMPLNDAAQKFADEMKAKKIPGMEQIPSFGTDPLDGEQINNEDEFIVKLRSMTVEPGLGEKLATALNDANGDKQYQSYDINGDGIKDYRIDVIGGTDRCTEPRYLVSSKSNLGKFDVLNFAPEALCSNGGDESGGGYNDATIDGKDYVVAEKQNSTSARYEFYDILAKQITGSRLDIAFNEDYDLSSSAQSCTIPGCAKLIGDIGKLFKEGGPVDDLPKQAKGSDKLSSRNGSVVRRADAERLARPLLEAAAEISDPKPEADGRKAGIENTVFADINNDGSPDLGAIIFDGKGRNTKLIFVEDTTGLWTDAAKLKVTDLSKDFPGYEIDKIAHSEDDYGYWYVGAIMQLRFDDEGKVHLFRAGGKRITFSNWYCCAIEVDRIIGDKVEAEFSSDVAKSKSIKSVKVDVVVTAPHGDVVWYTGP